MNILYIGSAGALSLIPFKYLLSTDHTVSAVGVANPILFDKKIIALQNESLALAAQSAAIPVIDLAQTVDKIIDQCEKYSIDIILMSCYARRLPDEIINLADIACFNMHPSLLPKFRGPEPIFWQMKLASDLGVSWHHVTDKFDAGDIVCQQKVFPDDGATYPELCSQLADAGSGLLAQLLSNVSENIQQSKPQDNVVASYHHYPEKQDFVIDVSRTAQQVYNFMAAAQIFSQTLPQPFLYRTGDYQFTLKKAVDYDNNLTLESVEVQADRLYIPCNVGVLIAIYTDKIAI